MATSNQLRVNLGNPIPELNAHQCLHVHQGTDEQVMSISFQRTIRVPDDDTTYDLPPGLGTFPLYNVAHYKQTLPEAMMLKGRCFMPVHPDSGIQGIFSDVKSIHEIDSQNGHPSAYKGKRKGVMKELEFPTIQLDKSGKQQHKFVMRTYMMLDMMAAAALNTYVAAMTSLEKKALPPLQPLDL
ncbi:hypothetical protein DL98DRAFT_588999 [Cadophora sp. DSE1049]|nr:hypothetical protein DL98DRAFT_588999 [Cadophora sp. DSE1049]